MPDATDSSPAARFAPGDTVGPYRLVRRVGAGGMGLVFLARDEGLARDVAVKVLRADAAEPGSESARLRERFLREAKAAARVAHPNVAAVYQVGHDGDVAYLAMEWLAGGSMSDHLRAQVILDWREAVTAARDAAAALAAAHAAGVVHRDVKPSNLMRAADGVVKLVDFGLARVTDASVDLTAAGTVLGTPAYLSPEQCRGEPATPLSDVYGLACTLFHLLASRPPFVAAGLPGLLYQHAHEPMPDVRRFADDVPAAVSAVLARAGAKDPADRYPSADALRADLDAVLAGHAVAATGVTAGRAATRPAAAGPDDVTSVIPPTAVAADDPPPPPVANNLPGEPNAFVGRQSELAAAADLLRRGRLVTLVGAGGTGKTRLAVRAARRALADFPGGAWLAELAALPAGADVTPAVAAATGVRESPGTPLIDAVVARFGAEPALLVLDNCEHVVDPAVTLVGRLLAECPALRVLATSRQPFRTAGEATLRVPSLGLPEADADGAELSAGELAQADAVRLFVDRAAAARPGFALTADNAPAVARICRRVDGIPLALELAAARLRLLSPRQIADRLDDAFRLLAGGPRDALPRQQTLRALVDWSHDLLTPAARVALARLSVFAGGWTIEAAEAVVADGGCGAGVPPASGAISAGGTPAPQRAIAEADVLDLLGELGDQSLVSADERDGAVRYRVLETIRQYATEKLAADPAARDAARRRHAGFFAEFVDRHVGELKGPKQNAALAALDADHDNVRAAIDAAVGLREVDAAVRLGAAAARYWQFRGGVAEGLARCRRVLALNPPDSADTARLMAGACSLAQVHGEAAEAAALAERVLAIARPLGRHDLAAPALNDLASLARDRGDLRLAFDLFGQSLAARRAAGDRGGEAAALNNLGVVAQGLGDVPAARDFVRRSMEVHRSVGDARRAAMAQLNLAEIELELGNTADARAQFASAERGLMAAGDEWSAAYATEGIGKCALAAGDAGGARAALERALAVVQRLGDKAAAADAIDYLARVALLEARPDAAEALAGQSVEIRVAMKDEVGLAGSLEVRAAVIARSDPARAAEMLACAAARRSHLGVALPAPLRADVERLSGELRLRLGEGPYESAVVAGRGRSALELLTC